MTPTRKSLKPRKLKPAPALPKDQVAWNHFVSMVREFETLQEPNAGQATSLPPMLRQELDRLCNLGNIIAQRFRDRLNRTEEPLRRPDEPGKAAPTPPRIRHISWKL